MIVVILNIFVKYFPGTKISQIFPKSATNLITGNIVTMFDVLQKIVNDGNWILTIKIFCIPLVN